MDKVMKFAFMCCLAIVAVGLSGCVETTHTEDYKFGIIEYQGGDFKGDQAKIEAYFADKNIPLTYVTYSGATQADCDEQAIADFNTYTRKISHEEIDALGLKGDNASFRFVVSRGGVTVAEWKYSKK